MRQSRARARVIVLCPDDWRRREQLHRARVEPWIEPRLRRRQRGERHLVDDFLFDYYTYRPGQLRTWHPGVGTVLAGEPADFGARLSDGNYRLTSDGLTADPERLERQRPRLEAVERMMALTSHREPRLGCFGLHEWAMVYRIGPDDVRHESWPLRMSLDEVADVVDAQGLRCTHFDAFRFYTDAARPRNEFMLTRADQSTREQPGCLHASMDLYRWAYTASPFVPSDLVADAFELARAIREVDMRASPYDLASLDLEPIRVETVEGRREFADLQRAFAEAGTALRARLLHWYRQWITPASPSVAAPSRALKGRQVMDSPREPIVR